VTYIDQKNGQNGYTVVSKLYIIMFLKGHGNEADFLGFLHKPVRHRSLTIHFEPFRFASNFQRYS
jgi:hypothetical protein